MLVEKIREVYVKKADADRRTGWPSGSRFGACTASLQFLRFPKQSRPERALPRDMLRFEHGHDQEERMNARLLAAVPGLTGLRQEVFHFRVDLDQAQTDQIAESIQARDIWGTVRPGFRPPSIKLVDGRPLIRPLPCPQCDEYGREHRHRPCGKMLGFVLDPDARIVWAPTFVDWIYHDKPTNALYVVEGKALSNFGFRDMLRGTLGWERRAQLMGEAEATGLDVAMLVVRNETQHIGELLYRRAAERITLTITKLNGRQEHFSTVSGGLLNDKGEPVDLPPDEEWDFLATADHPYDRQMADDIRAHIRRVLLFKGNASPGSRDVWRQYGPDFACPTCEGTGTQSKAKSGGADLKRGPKPCPDCGQVGQLESTTLKWPCSYCKVVGACMPFASLELSETRPRWIVERRDWESSGLSFVSPEGPIVPPPAPIVSPEPPIVSVHEADRGDAHRDNSHAVLPEAAQRPPGAGAAVAPDTGPPSKERPKAGTTGVASDDATPGSTEVLAREVVAAETPAPESGADITSADDPGGRPGPADSGSAPAAPKQGSLDW